MSFASRLKNFFVRVPAVSDAFFDDLSDLLVEGDFGAEYAYRITELLRAYCKKEKISSPEEVRRKLAIILEDELLKGGNSRGELPSDNDFLSKEITIALLLGVNGVGKTTTAAKLASLCQDTYKFKPLLAAADTFRAAAIDQLKIHGEKLGMRVIAHQQGGDPGAVVYDAIEAAIAGAGNVIIVDTAGRMHTKSALVQELQKIDRIIETKTAGAKIIKYLVLDATTGRNAIAQAEIFNEAVKVSGVILTKYDSTAKGGVVFSLASELGLPIKYLCTGEKYGDIHPFDSKLFIQEFIGLV